jgi:hypothetical protein
MLRPAIAGEDAKEIRSRGARGRRISKNSLIRLVSRTRSPLATLSHKGRGGAAHAVIARSERDEAIQWDRLGWIPAAGMNANDFTAARPSAVIARSECDEAIQSG